MAVSVTPDSWVLGVDVGATNTKFALVGPGGTLLSRIQRRRTPAPCTPERFVGMVVERARGAGAERVAVGFPGEVRGGVVVRPGNLSRVDGVASSVDEAIDAKWRGYDLEGDLVERLQCDVRVRNDAALAALGCCTFGGREIVIGLGTGLGLALCVDRSPVEVRDVGGTEFADAQTFDERLGERARELDERRWFHDVARVIERLGNEFAADVVHLTGGNARRVSIDRLGLRGMRIVIDGNEAPMHGAARLFELPNPRSTR